MIVTEVVPLSLLARGQAGRICDIAGEPGLVHRLAELGLRTGAEIRMVQPGRPCIIALDHQRFSLRSDDEDLVLVEVVHS